jgi:hypothetical protein
MKEYEIMKEVKSQSEWVGKTLTCQTCGRSFEVEAGDEIKPGFYRGGGRIRGHMPTRFNLPCGHIWALPKEPIKSNIGVSPVI